MSLILARPTALRAVVRSNAVRVFQADPRFMDEMFDPIWDACESLLVNPVGGIVQSIHETNGGRFTGRVQAGFYNTAGIKCRNQAMFPGITTGDEPLAHQMFPNWTVGAIAHAQHLRAYTGWALPAGTVIVDPRYQFVIGRHACVNWEDLNGRWAYPGRTYGTNLETMISRIQEVA